ncbi:MAG: MraY family glycosyltransferase [Desulfonatronovibrionaceae bacterium]
MNQAAYSLSQVSVLALAFFLSIFLALICTPMADRLAGFLGCVDEPGQRKIHSGRITRLGGVAMAAPLLVNILFFAGLSRQMAAFLAGAGVIFMAGLADDKNGLNPAVKFILQIIAVLLFMVLGGTYLQDLGDIAGTGALTLGAAGPVVTVVAMAGVINSFNLSDGLDGLAAGITAIACLFFIPFAYAQENWFYLVALVSLLGVILGFLRFNSHPARLFMGDSGSLLLGFCMAAAAVVLTQGQGPGKGYQPVTALIILSLPIADTLYVMAARILQGKSPVQPDRTHIHHRLMDAGFSHQLTVSGIYCFMLGMGVLAWLIRPAPEWAQFYFVLGIYAVLYAGLYFLEGLTVARGIKVGFNLSLRPTSARGQYLLRRIAGKSRLVQPVFSLALIPAVFMARDVPLEFRYYILFVLLFGICFYPWKGRMEEAGMGHAVVFFSLYSLLLVLNLSAPSYFRLDEYLSLVSLLALIWTGLRVMKTRRVRVLWPGSFEILLLGTAMVAPIIIHYSFFMGFDFRWQMLISFFQAVPLFLLNKAFLRRKPAKIRNTALFIWVLLALCLV